MLFGSEGCSDDKPWPNFYLKICIFLSSILLSSHNKRPLEFKNDSCVILMDQLQHYAMHTSTRSNTRSKKKKKKKKIE